MRHMLKVLLITIVGLVVENGEGMNAPPPPPAASPILDLPIGVNGTPGLVVGAGNPIFTQKTVNGVPNANCLHIIVPNTPAHTARVAQGGGIAAARTADGNIYFPRNGAQPTTPEAVEYSCANIDNRENSPITDWYMQMFGVVPFRNAGAPGPNDYIKAGWTNPGAPIVAERIISYNFMAALVANLQQLAVLYAALPAVAPLPPMPTLAGTPLAGITVAQVLTKDKQSVSQLMIDLQNMSLAVAQIRPIATNIFKSLELLELLAKQMEFDDTIGTFVNKLEDSFKKNFRKIASTAVGRTLLYRILIEVRRHIPGANNGILEVVPPPILPWLISRNSLRKLTIDFDNFMFALNGCIFVENSSTHTSYVIGNMVGVGNAGKYDAIVRCKASNDIALFHEMNHWYHALRDIQRLLNENNMSVWGGKRHFNNTVTGGNAVPAGSEAIGAYYWGGLDPAWTNMYVTEQKWSENYEEIRNILGVPIQPGIVHPVAGTINGDDLSENLYRMCKGEPLRLGHAYNGWDFFEDSRVVDKIINTCFIQRQNYNCINRQGNMTDRLYSSALRGLGSGRF